MFFGVYITVLLFHCGFAIASVRLCITPNGELGVCIPLYQCNVIKQAISFLEEDAIEFARKSRCGHDPSNIFVCCGTVANTVNATTETTAIVTNTIPKSSLLPDRTVCGRQIKLNRIIGGMVTEINEFPWMVALKYTTIDGTPAGFRCSGTLINSRFVLTTAQCLFIGGYYLTEARLGEWRISTINDCVEDTETKEICADPVLDLVVEKQIYHPYYNKKTGSNDIALLRLEKKVQYSDSIRPICLPALDIAIPSIGTRMQISGWGITENGTQSDVKLKVVIPLVDIKECKKIFPNYTNISPKQACAGGEDNKDACIGDSGGPLMRILQSNDGMEDTWYQEGIIYRGIGCGQSGIPALYTRVSRYMTWILRSIEAY